VEFESTALFLSRDRPLLLLKVTKNLLRVECPLEREKTNPFAEV